MKIHEIEFLKKQLSVCGLSDHEADLTDKDDYIEAKVNYSGEVSSSLMRSLLDVGEVHTKRSGAGLRLRVCVLKSSITNGE